MKDKRKILSIWGDRLQKFRNQRLDKLNKDRQYHAFQIGQIVHVYQTGGNIVSSIRLSIYSILELYSIRYCRDAHL